MISQSGNWSDRHAELRVIGEKSYFNLDSNVSLKNRY